MEGRADGLEAAAKVIESRYAFLDTDNPLDGQLRGYLSTLVEAIRAMKPDTASPGREHG